MDISNLRVLTDFELSDPEEGWYNNYFDGYLAGKIMYNGKWHYYNCIYMLEDYTRIYCVLELTDDLKKLLDGEWKWKDMYSFPFLETLKW